MVKEWGEEWGIVARTEVLESDPEEAELVQWPGPGRNYLDVFCLLLSHPGASCLPYYSIYILNWDSEFICTFWLYLQDWVIQFTVWNLLGATVPLHVTFQIVSTSSFPISLSLLYFCFITTPTQFCIPNRLLGLWAFSFSILMILYNRLSLIWQSSSRFPL